MIETRFEKISGRDPSLGRDPKFFRVTIPTRSRPLALQCDLGWFLTKKSFERLAFLGTFWLKVNGYIANITKRQIVSYVIIYSSYTCNKNKITNLANFSFLFGFF